MYVSISNQPFDPTKVVELAQLNLRNWVRIDPGSPCALRAAPCAALRPWIVALCALRPAPCALRPAPCALRPAPRCGLSAAPCALRAAPCAALRPARCALRPAPCVALRPARCALRPAPCASLDPRRGRSAHRWGLAGAALRIAGASQGKLWVSLRPRRGLQGPRVPTLSQSLCWSFDAQNA